MPFVAPWMGLEIIILSEVNQIEKDKYHKIEIINFITQTWNLKSDTNEITAKTEIDPQTQKTNFCLSKEKEREALIISLGLTDT